MHITVGHLAPIVSLIAGILILIMPRLLNYIVAIYLIVVGVLGLGIFPLAQGACARRSPVFLGAHPSPVFIEPWPKLRASAQNRRNSRSAGVQSPKRRSRSVGRRPKQARKNGKQAPAKTPKNKWVYAFGDGQAEGSADMRDLLGGKGAGLAEMANLGLPVPPGFTITTEVCTYFTRTTSTIRTTSKRRSRRRSTQVGRITGKMFRRRRQSAAGLGALGRPRLDAGHDGHRAQSRPQRRDGRGAGQEIRRPALRL